ncbi:MAG TPA: NAD(P)H-dependent oxidoreductase subunit E [Ignavibacteria bacterium]
MRIARIQLPDVKQNIVSSNVDLDLLNPLIKKFKHKKGNLIPLLQGAQNLFGYIPIEVFLKISTETGLKLNDMYGVATFYAQFRLKPVGKIIIRVCHGTACHVQNATKVTEDLITYLNVKDGETTDDRLFTLETVACLGCCSLAPVMMIGEDTYGKLSGKKAVDVVKDIKRKEISEIQSKQTEKFSKN